MKLHILYEWVWNDGYILFWFNKNIRVGVLKHMLRGDEETVTFEVESASTVCKLLVLSKKILI